MDVDSYRGEGFRQYYITKIEELQLIVAEKSQNLRRLQAQRNELNAKGTYDFINLEFGEEKIMSRILHSTKLFRLFLNY